MKYLLIVLCSLVFQSYAEEKVLCSLSSVYIYRLLDRVQNIENDKVKHCSITCMLTLRCGPADALGVGYLKELIDIPSAGNFELADLKANFYGMKIALGLIKKNKIKFNGSHDNQCIQRCSSFGDDLQ